MFYDGQMDKHILQYLQYLSLHWGGGEGDILILLLINMQAFHVMTFWNWRGGALDGNINLPVLALGLHQFAFSEKKSHLANDFAIIFRQIWAAGEIHFLMTKNRSNCYVFGIIGKLFKNAREWCLFQTDILKSFWVINPKFQIWKFIYFCQILVIFSHIYNDLFLLTCEWMNEWMNEWQWWWMECMSE